MSDLKNQIDTEELGRLLGLSEAELYRQITPESSDALYSKDAREAHGRKIFKNLLPAVRKRVCGAYKERPVATQSSVDIAAIVAAALFASSKLSVAQIPILPLAALIAKIGLEHICKDE